MAAEQHNESIHSVHESLNQSMSSPSAKKLEAKRGSVEAIQNSVEGSKTIEVEKIVYNRDNVESDFRPVLIQMWQELSKNYKSQMKNIFHNFRRNRENQFKSRACVQRKFL